jgi:hypothetical protein
MNQPGKKSGCGNRGKTNYVFPPFPQPLLLLTNQDEKAAHKQKTIVYTKSLADPADLLLPSAPAPVIRQCAR